MRPMDLSRSQRYAAAAAVVLAAFASSYVYSTTASASAASTASTAPTPVTAGAPTSAGQAGAGCACCGGGGSSTPVRAAATLEGGVQRIAVATAGGSWDPNEIVLKAGAPAEITFAEGQGCLAQVVFPTLGLKADLTSGGAVVKVPALQPGDYEFSCGMSMVFGKLVVE
jgi:hypothetical protein